MGFAVQQKLRSKSHLGLITSRLVRSLGNLRLMWKERRNLPGAQGLPGLMRKGKGLMHDQLHQREWLFALENGISYANHITSSQEQGRNSYRFALKSLLQSVVVVFHLPSHIAL